MVILKVFDKRVFIHSCIYQDNRYQLKAFPHSLMNNTLLRDVICNGVLNLNALYKNFIDDNYEFHQEVSHHQVNEWLDENGILHLEITTLDSHVVRIARHSLQLKPITTHAKRKLNVRRELCGRVQAV
ncbi:hypothetical protein PP175_26410 (plasmid) [Aneurinibacillus sp. Ricciae_BoGa-3]|uniref:hypothetical protein n=1 Tax=Aneurinibacillus sp. Ricciae_BoGa-3 TaxID=3022697 RepID=UPI002340AB50|nr:hypothetical protein [Aneurinibacillus sp. Ricciae_BoGa-3]WCK57601.1 hypothetical protein PP175_26410 [Aneurinibacillus sp. Ricciae_BoGa-3]